MYFHNAAPISAATIKALSTAACSSTQQRDVVSVRFEQGDVTLMTVLVSVSHDVHVVGLLLHPHRRPLLLTYLLISNTVVPSTEIKLCQGPHPASSSSLTLNPGPSPSAHLLRKRKDNRHGTSQLEPCGSADCLHQLPDMPSQRL